MKDLGTVGTDPQSFAYGINSVAQIVGGTTDDNFVSLHAFIWEKGSIAPEFLDPTRIQVCN
jgi:probable HAF family extracellular repeat protein